MIIGTLEDVAEPVFVVSKARAVTLVCAATPEGLLEDFAAARVDWIVWPAEPRVELAVECEMVCAARPVAASCVTRGDSTLGMLAAGWCVGKVVGGGSDVRLRAARDVWLRAWVRLLADGAERGRKGGAFVAPLLSFAVEGVTSKALRESTGLSERTFRDRLSRCGCRGSRRVVMGVTARELGPLPEGELAVRLAAGLWREERVAESG